MPIYDIHQKINSNSGNTIINNIPKTKLFKYNQEKILNEPEYGSPIFTLPEVTEYSNSIDITPDGRILAFFDDQNTNISSNFNPIVRLWDIMHQKLYKILTLPMINGLTEEETFLYQQNMKLKFSQTGKYLGTSILGAILIWDSSTGELLNMLKGGGNPIINLGPNQPEGAIFLVGSSYPQEGGPDHFTWVEISTFDTKKVSDFDFSNDEKFLIVGYRDGYIEQWDIEKNSIIHIYPPDDTPTNEKFIYQIISSPDSSKVAVLSIVPDFIGGTKKQLKLIDPQNGEEINYDIKLQGLSLITPDFKLYQYTKEERIKLSTFVTELKKISSFDDSSVYQLFVSARGEFFVNLRSDRSINIIDSLSNRTIHTIQSSKETQDITNAILSPDGTNLISTHESKSIRFWNIGPKTLLNSFIGNQNNLDDLIFTPDEENLLIKYEGCEISKINIILKNKNDYCLDGWLTTFSSDRSSFVLLRGVENNTNVTIYNSMTFEVITSFNITNLSLSNSGSPWESVALSKNNTYLVVAIGDVTVWDVNTKSLIRTLPRNNTMIKNLRFSPDGMFLSYCDCPYRGTDGPTLLWRTDTWLLLKIFNEGSIISHTPDNQFVVQTYDPSGFSEPNLVIYDSDLENIIYSFQNLSIGSISFSSNGLMATISGKGLDLWNFTERTLIQNLAISFELSRSKVALSTNGTFIAIASDLVKIYFIDTPILFDDDLDSLPNSWEALNNLNSENYWDKFEDPDGDGLMNSIEYYLGLNPLKTDSNGNGITDRDEFGFPLFLIIENPESNVIEFFIIIFSILSIIGIGLYLSRNKGSPIQENLLLQLSEPENIKNLRMLYQKVVIGIENSKQDWKTDYPDEEIEFLIQHQTNDYTTSIDVFPPDIQTDLKSELRGRSILILIELAYKYPEQAHVLSIAEGLKIPRSTISFEIKKLVFLQYIRQVQDLNSLQDTRYKFYSLTPKGIIFLNLLKESLSLNIHRMKIENLQHEI
ncbi:MAG: WD40 repeat domain-containing protein [Candidatus Hodarchaeales archaeon]|jgi:WD40 repeat protein/DNA-binding MarR family transcriptional regulator